MQRKHVSLFLAATLAILTFASCKKKTNTLGKHIPKTAAFVGYVNGESLNTKLPWAEIQATNWYKDVMADSTQSAYAKLVLQNPENTGINAKSDFLFFADIDSNKLTTICFEGAIADAAKFKTMLAQDSTNKGVESSKEGYTLVTTKNGCFAYNKEKFFALTITNQLNEAESYFDTVVAPEPILDYAAEILKVIKLDEAKSLAKDERFTELVNQEGDFKMWYSAENLSAITKSAMNLGVGNFEKLYKGAVSIATINFNNGKIDLDSKSYAGKELTEFYNKYSGGKVNEAMLQNLPAQNPLMVFAINFKPEALQAMLKLLGVDGLASMGMAQFGISFDDFVKANKGDILFALDKMAKDSLTGVSKPKGIFAASIGDKASFNKLIDLGKKAGMGLAASGDAASYPFNVNDKYFAIGTDKATVDGFLSAANKTTPAYASKITGGPMGVFFNFKEMFIQTKSSAKDSIGIEMNAISQKFWEDLTMKGGDVKKDAVLFNASVNMADKSANSLKQLNTYIDKMYTLDKKDKEAKAITYGLDY
jgi:hypothetical protein